MRGNIFITTIRKQTRQVCTFDVSGVPQRIYPLNWDPLREQYYFQNNMCKDNIDINKYRILISKYKKIK